MKSLVFLILILASLLIFMCRSKIKSSAPLPTPNALEDYGFAIRDQKLYYKEEPVEGIDPGSFEVIDEYYAKDSGSVLFYKTYRESRDYYLSKKNSLVILKDAHPDNFVSLTEGYARDQNKAYFEGESFPVKDLSSLRVLDSRFCADDQAAYLELEEIKGSHGPSFELISSMYAKDSFQVYYFLYPSNGKIEYSVLSNDPSQFELIEHPYSRDKNNIFYFGDKHPSKHPESFELIGNGYNKDQDNIFFQTMILKEADKNSFRLFSENQQFTGDGAYASDARFIYYKNLVIRDADLNSFQILNEFYSKDLKRVYFQEKVIHGADVHSFEVFPHQMGDADAKDKNQYYQLGKINKEE